MRALITILLFLSLSNTYSQTRFVKGIVTDWETKEPIPFAYIYIPEAKQVYSTNLEGQFTIEINDAVKTHLFINYTGYQSKIQEIEKGVENVEIKLETGISFPPMVIVKYKMHHDESYPEQDSIGKLRNKY